MCVCVCACMHVGDEEFVTVKTFYTLVPVKPSICICDVLNEVVALSEQISLSAQLVCETFNLSL